MKSDAGGKITLGAEVTQIDKHGIWLWIGQGLASKVLIKVETYSIRRIDKK